MVLHAGLMVKFVLWILLAGFTIAFVGTSFGEGEPTAAIRGGLLFGLISVIAGVGVWRIIVRRAREDGQEIAPGS
jgi:uncharacterized membrane protein (DUF485 family)